MILKFREPVYQYKEVEGSPNLQSEHIGWHWYVFGEVSGIDYSEVTYTQEFINGKEEENQAAMKVDRWVQDHNAMELTGPRKYKLMTFDYHDKRITVAFNTVAFLCNEQGDTIEKIHA